MTIAKCKSNCISYKASTLWRGFISLFVCGTILWQVSRPGKLLNKDQFNFQMPLGKEFQLAYQYQVHDKELIHLKSWCRPALTHLPSSLAGKQWHQHICHCSKLKDKRTIINFRIVKVLITMDVISQDIITGVPQTKTTKTIPFESTEIISTLFLHITVLVSQTYYHIDNVWVWQTCQGYRIK